MDRHSKAKGRKKSKKESEREGLATAEGKGRKPQKEWGWQYSGASNERIMIIYILEDNLYRTDFKDNLYFFEKKYILRTFFCSFGCVCCRLFWAGASTPHTHTHTHTYIHPDSDTLTQCRRDGCGKFKFKFIFIISFWSLLYLSLSLSGLFRSVVSLQVGVGEGARVR